MAVQIDTRINVATVGSILVAAMLVGLYVGRLEAAYDARMSASEAAICEMKQELALSREDRYQLGVVVERVDGIYRIMTEFKDAFKRRK
ncbi:hypothetical protein GO013_15605 [Pseudodesulfovibrio sp. JC047]|uniref:hypothetical protein n=1 Tax=Pseudodesulfovibrio sp. JC047 TaxID=2683199 RepID=UPI0013D3540B|nr:hypothetical protein [Pseudodesulfovibrio sp. JC047]NDV20836.1 hypothetical protein [Pseudodesulfovibrio sp. JC047]